MTKPFHAGRASESGVVGAEMAAIGWTATDKILEAPRGFFRAAGGGFDAAAIAGKLGKPWTFASPGISIKPHPSGSLTHPGMTEMLRLIKAHDIKAADVVRVTRRHQLQHAERADPSPPDRRVAGQVLDGVLHGDPAARRPRRPAASSPTRRRIAPTSRR